MYDKELVKESASGQWADLISAICGIDRELFDRKNHPCPKCGGKDRFRFTDIDGNGACICNKCFRSKNGDGFSAVQWLTGCSFPRSIEQVAQRLGVPESKKSRAKAKPRPDDKLEFLDWSDNLAALWCLRKPPITPEVVQSFGGKFARYRNRYVVLAFPIFGPQLTDTPPVGWLLYPASGSGGLPAFRNGQFEKWVPRKVTYGSRPGLFNEAGLDRLRKGRAAGAILWKCEGPTDAMAVESAAEVAGRGEDCVAISNAFGSEENPAWMAEVFRNAEVRVIHDADTSGVNGAGNWSAAISKFASSCRVASLPYEVLESGGKDARSFVADSTYADLLELPLSESEEVAGEQSIEPVTNVEIEYNDDGEARFSPLTMQDIIERIGERLDGWPRRSGGALFVHDGDGISWLLNTASLFGWLQRSAGLVDWRRLPGCVGKEELFAELRRTATDYGAIEKNPHFPRIPNHYYACPEPEAGDGKTLDRLIDRFSPENELDREMILGLFVTAFWGGAHGSRPAFVITSDHGPGVGKSKMTDILSHLLGGDTGSQIEVGQHDDIADAKARMLSTEGMESRIVRIDNVKSLRFSWSDLESLITQKVISAKRMYVGEGRRPNTFSWVVTLNGVSLSTDMAQRSVIVHLRRPDRSGTWETDTVRLIDENRPAIIADIKAFFQRPRQAIEIRSRWAQWEQEVLSRLRQPKMIQALLKSRSEGADAEREEAEILHELFSEKVDCDWQRFHIPSKVAGRWFREATENGKSVQACCSILNRYISEGKISWLRINPSRTNGRGFLFNGHLDSAINYEKFTNKNF